jgi:hypothetical protein
MTASFQKERGLGVLRPIKPPIVIALPNQEIA